MIVGEGGMSPEYFHTRLTFYEADDFLAGMHRRYHTQWECARWQTTFTAKCAGNKSYTAPDFPWETEQREEKPITAEELDELKAQGSAWAARLNNDRH